MRIVFNKAKAEQRLNLEIDDRQLGLWNPVLMRIELQNCLTNDHLDNISNAFRQFLSLNDHNLAKFNATQIRDQVLQLRYHLLRLRRVRKDKGDLFQMYVV